MGLLFYFDSLCMTCSNSLLKTQSILRQQLRLKRRELPSTTQTHHAQCVTHYILNAPFYKQAKSIALYLSADGEIELSLLINQIHEQGKQCYLPVILSKKKGLMGFAPYTEQTALIKNCFGIFEPIYQEKELRTADQIEVILAPLVAFDEQRHRMGMGGGYYDRALQHLAINTTQSRHLKPLFVGIAHELQCVKTLPVQTWDIALNAIITEQRLTLF